MSASIFREECIIMKPHGFLSLPHNQIITLLLKHHKDAEFGFLHDPYGFLNEQFRLWL